MVNYEFFESLTLEEAHAYFQRFLTVERQAVEEMKPAAAARGLELNYSMSSLADVLKWMMEGARAVRVPVPEDEPWWIRQAHADGLIQFDEDTKTMILRAAYYIGECFARLPGLRWTTGDLEYMQQKMPVIAGFRNDQELPPLVVMDVVFARVIGRGLPATEADETIRVWLNKCPPPQH
jgi:hypothetical protein